MKVLFVASEAYPLIKTGGLGDVAYSLPHALAAQGCDVRLVLPAYRDVLNKFKTVTLLGWFDLQGAHRTHPVRILEVKHTAFPFPIWLVDSAELFDRRGNPYQQPNGYDWADNAERFTVFARAIMELARDTLKLDWKPDAVHANDWQTGLVPAFLDLLPERPKRVFTIHNLAYGGRFSHDEFMALHLPAHWWSAEGAEFYGGLSMLKAGIVYADSVTTVSPTYAREICTAAFGYGMEGLLQSRSYKLHGILNGIDPKVWNPAKDPLLAAHYSSSRLAHKTANKAELLKRLGATETEQNSAAPVLGMVSRLVEQKGVDLVINAIPTLIETSNARFVILGTGHNYFEQRLRQLAAQYPQRVFIFIGYDETLAHLVEAGADAFMMPSRFEPCGLNQMYSLRYGTPPIVFHTGGLADTVVDATAEHLKQGVANGFVFYEPSTRAFVDTLNRVLHTYTQPRIWQKLQKTGMKQDFGWAHSAEQYLHLYRH